MWRRRRWQQLLDILEYLPRTSAYAHAMAVDEDLAEQVAAVYPKADPGGKWQRSHREYTPEVEMLTAVFDRLGELIRLTGAVHGARGKLPPPGPRPVNAITKIRERLRLESHRSLVSRLIKPANREVEAPRRAPELGG